MRAGDRRFQYTIVNGDLHGLDHLDRKQPSLPHRLEITIRLRYSIELAAFQSFEVLCMLALPQRRGRRRAAACGEPTAAEILQQTGETIMQIHEGGCLCSAIRYRISDTPDFSSICHCATCRRASAAPLVAWLTVNRERFKLLSGAPQVYRSSQGVTRQFCRVCGSQLTYENTGTVATIDVATVSLDDPGAFPPTLEVWLEHRLPWQAANQALRHYPRGTLLGT